MHDGKTPSRNPLMAHEMVALANNADRHPQALSYEIHRVNMETLVQLAYQEHADFLTDVPFSLAEAAYNEIERRTTAKANLIGELSRIRSIAA